MLSCETCQVQLLEYVYDLLDDADRQALEAHLSSCPACQTALGKARAQQQLLAAAAKMEFPSVAFQPPAAIQPPQALPAATLPAARPTVDITRRRLQRAVRWSVAAALLLAITAVSLVAAMMYNSVSHDLATIQTWEKTRAEADQDRRDATGKIQAAQRELQEKRVGMEKALREREMKLVVQGPASVQPGAPAEYQISTINLNNQPVAARVSVQMKDSASGADIGAAMVANAVEGQPGLYRVKLPADLPLRQGSLPILQVSAKRESGAKTEVKEELDLASKVYLTHLTTDKPMYQPGEMVYFRSLTLERTTLKAVEQDLHLIYTIKPPLGEEQVFIQGGNGLQKETPGSLTIINGPDGKPLKGVGAGAYYLDAGSAGGEYILTVREAQNRFSEQRRKFIVNHYQKPRLNKELDFNRKTYGPGDEVQAAVKVSSNDGTPLRGQNVEATITIDGKQYGADGKVSDKKTASKLEADGKSGKVTIRFKLPAQIEKGQANLNLTFTDGANVEPLSRSIPIVLKKLDVEFYPEGGDLVAGLTNRVYFSVRTTLGKPADLKGRLLEDGKPLDVEVATLNDDKEPGVNQGLGRFEFTPKADAKYTLRIDSPTGITGEHVLPKVQENGVGLTVAEGVVGSDGALKVAVQSTTERNLLVGAYCRGRLLDSVRLEKVKSKTEATLKVNMGQGGVCRVTVFEDKADPGKTRHDLLPVAERLVYKQPKEQLNLLVHADREAYAPEGLAWGFGNLARTVTSRGAYVPGQHAKLTIKAVNENEEVAPAVVMLAVVDKSVVTMADEKTARSMPTHFLLTTEVRRPEDLEYADFLLGPQTKAKQALDLLLGTQGWRRFAEQNPDKFQKDHKEEADRLLVTIGQSLERHELDSIRREYEKIEADCEAKIATLQEESASANQRVYAAATAVPYVTAKEKIGMWKQRWERSYFLGTPVLGLLLLATALTCLGLGLMKELAKARRYYVAAAVSLALVLIGMTFWLTDHSDKLGVTKTADATKEQAIPAPTAAQAKVARAKNGAFRELEDELPGEDAAFGGGRAGAGFSPADKALQPAPVPNMPAMKPGAPQAEAALAKADLQDGEGKKLFAEKRRDRAEEDFAKGKGEAKQMQADRRKAVGGDGKDAARFDEQLRQQRGAAMQPIAPGGVFPARGGPRGPAVARGAQLMPPMIVREYAHQRTVGMTPELRSDSTETLFWQPVLVLPDGKGEVSFDLSDWTTTFQVTAFAHTLDGRLGAATYQLDSRLPFSLMPKLPIEVTASDKIDVPLSVTNNTGEKRTVTVNVKELDGLALTKGQKNEEFETQSGVPVRKVYRVQPLIHDGDATLTFEGKTTPFGADLVRNSFRVVPEGFPFVGTHSDMLEGASISTVQLPETWVKGSLRCQVNVYPSTLADLQKGLEGLLREPNGCFEQTSTTNYPNVLILGYLKESDQAKPEVERRARELLSRGYQKLTSFECTNTGKQKKEGYEWFGGTAPAHEALTAYGLMQFRDMAKVSEVDAQMLERTRKYLLDQKDGNGGFKRNSRALDTFGRAPDNITNAYIVWALTEGSADDDITKELNELLKQAKTSKDPYFLALVANSLINRSRHDEANALLKTITGAQKEDGHLDAAQTSITGSGGRDLQIETTALGILAWLKASNPAEFTMPTMKAVKWIGQQRGGYGGFGSTQSTILTLKALIAFTKANKKTPEAGELTLFVGDKQVGKLAFPAGASEALTLNLENVEEILKPGENKVRVEMTGKNVFPYTLTWSYNTLRPVSAEKPPVKLETSLSKTEVEEGDGVQLRVKVENVSGQGQGMAVAVLGLPGGLTIPEDLKQLKEYVRLPVDGGRPLVSAFEIRGRELVLYWRDLAPDQKIELAVDLTCRVPGEYSGPASRAYLYYNADHKHWVEPLKVNIAAK